MALKLVNYSDSSDEEMEVQTDEPIDRMFQKMILPNPFEKPVNMIDAEDDAGTHDGRTRLFPHERGNWVSYVYIHCDKTELISNLQDELFTLLKSTSPIKDVEFHRLEELHMSLTRTIVLQHHWIDGFVQSIENSLRNTQRFIKFTLKITQIKFWLHLNSIKIYCNDNQSRTFLSLSLSDDSQMSIGKQNVHSVVEHLDNCLREFNLPTFYNEASFHVSLLWCLGDKRNELQSLLPQFHNIFARRFSSHDSIIMLDVDRLFCKIGNKLYSFHL